MIIYMKSVAVILVLPFGVNGCSNTISFDVLVAPASARTQTDHVHQGVSYT